MQKLLAISALALLVISCKKPIADFSYAPANPKAGETVQFTNKSTDARSYSWNFGDMSIGSEENPAHVYENAGNYIVDL
ncbi:MAG: PKD domain-containing protein, partial [Bacteroidia bacterium]|nr:PKD domain-containing protein [Bacteroidia bacterium]